jgi:hypothetical protein
MGNTNMKEFFDFDHGKLEKIDRCEQSARYFFKYYCEKSDFPLPTFHELKQAPAPLCYVTGGGLIFPF